MNHILLTIILIAIIVVVLYGVYVFLRMPKDSQINQLREWLLYAVAKAEKELGSGTGKLKLRYVYDMFISKFNYLAKIISFEAFSILVDEALDIFRDLLEQNDSIAKYIGDNKQE